LEIKVRDEVKSAVIGGPFSVLNKEQRSLVQKLFTIWGGIPRDALQSVLSRAGFGAQSGVAMNYQRLFDVSKAELDGAIAKTDLEVVTSFVGEVDGKEDISHKVLHIRSIAPYDEARKKFDFASKYVKEEVLKRLELFNQEKTRLFLLKTDGPSSTLRGHVFEKWAHTALQSGGTFRTRNLDDDTANALPLPKMSMTVFHDISQVKPEMSYCRPLSKNFCAIDALIPSQNVLLQMTKNRNHPIKSHGVRKCLPRLVHPKSEVRFYFVVPDTLFDDFRKQRFVNKRSRKGEAKTEEEEEEADKTDDEGDLDLEEQEDVELIPNTLISKHPPKNVTQYVLEVKV